MAGSDHLSRWAVAGAGIIVVITAGIHALGYPSVGTQLAASGLDPVWRSGIKGLWFIFSLHLVIVGALFLAASVRPADVSRVVLIITALVPTVDAVMLYSFVGVFIGTVALAIAALLAYVGVALRPAATGGEHGT